MEGDALLAGAAHHVVDQVEGADRGELAGQLVLVHERAVRAGALRDDDVVQVHVGLEGTAGSDADQALAAKRVDELVGVQGD